MKSNKFIRVVGVTLFLALMLGLVGIVSAQSIKSVTTSLDVTAGEPSTIDPQLSQDNVQIQVENELFPGLTYLNVGDASIGHGTASSWDISADGLTYTFHITPNISWVRYNADSGAVEQVKDDSGNVRFLTAQDYVYSYTRALDPATADPYAFVLGPLVVNGEKFDAGDASVTAADLGIKAIDDNTFQVTSPIRRAYALTVYGMYMARAVPQWAIDAAGNVWTEPENTNTYGPFALKEWEHNDHLTFIKNPFWAGNDTIPVPKLDEVVYRFLDSSVQFTEYLAGNLDAAEVPVSQIDFVKSDSTLSAEYVNGFYGCSYYYTFNVQLAPFDNVHMRRAFSYAIDRQSIVDNVTKGGQIPARWFVRPGLVAAPTLETNPDLGISYDPDKAKTELAAALSDMGLASVADVPPITLAFGNSSTHTAVATAIQQMWTENLGITVQMKGMDTTTYFDTERTNPDQVFRNGWCLDYADADNFDRVVMRSDAVQNYGHYNDPKFDQLVDQAAALTDEAQRRDLYAQAEQLLNVDDAGIAPIYWYTVNQIVKPYVERAPSIIGLEAYELWDVQAH